MNLVPPPLAPPTPRTNKKGSQRYAHICTFYHTPMIHCMSICNNFLLVASYLDAWNHGPKLVPPPRETTKGKYKKWHDTDGYQHMHTQQKI